MVTLLPSERIEKLRKNERYLALLTRLEDEEKDRLLNHMLLTQLLEELPEADRDLIRMRYFEDMTQSEVAKNLGISQVQVSRLEKKILLSMRHKGLC